MAELMLKVLRGASKYEDGDVIFAPNNRRIKDVHAQHIIKANRSLQDFYLSKVMQYKFQRISSKEVKRIILATLDEEIISDKPNAKGEQMDVPLYIMRRMQSPKHQIFGSVGNEYWYGGRTAADLTVLSTIWQEIESKTIYREVDHTKWPYTEGELKNYLCIAVDDFDNEARGELESPIVDDKDPENPIIVKHRKHKVDWTTLPGLSLGSQADILAKGIKVDMREAVTFTRSQIVEVKIG